MSELRMRFEKWIKSPPFEKSVARRKAGSAWPGQYDSYEVQLAWEAWEEASHQERVTIHTTRGRIRE